MTSNDNPYQPSNGLPPVDRHIVDQKQFGVAAQIGIGIRLILAPAFVAILTAGICPFLDNPLGWDERYVSLFMGIPAAVFAIFLSTKFWRRGFRVVPIIGTLAWILFCLFTMLVTIAFWGG